MQSCLIGFVLVVLAIRPYESAAGPEPTVVERFEKRVRPVLAARCWRCHGPEQHKGGLRLDSADGVATGGDSGPVVVAGKPEESRLIQAVHYAGDLKMPPKGRLNDAEAAELTEWVRTGAVWPESRTATGTGPPASRTTKGPAAFWAFQAPRDPAPPEVQAVDWPSSPLDRFILAALERKGLVPASPSGKRTLIRRATFDLTGLPPTLEEVESFVADDCPEAFARVVDRLLASPRYGERWGRHWLDLARYADSNGMDENVAYANAFRYRDYVVHAFNADKPYDQFVKEQIAGDLLARTGDGPLNHERLTATGFLVIGPKMLAEDDPVKMEMDIIDEQLDTVGRVFMGLTIGCARCHDHKFDPITTADYYALAGIFKSTRSMQNHKVVAMWNERPLGTEAQRAAFEVHEREVNRRNAEIKARVDEAKAALTRNGRAVSENPETGFPPKTIDELRRLRKDLAEFEKKALPLPKAMSVEEQAITDLRVHIRGNHLTLGEEVPRRFPRILAGADQRSIDATRSGRLEFASWLARPDHPLTARVMANRIWLGHFGDGLVRSPDNLGHLGDRPVHPELLDWLAHRFVESGWSIKAMHRLIILSSTYQMSTRYNSEAALADPENRLHWRMGRRRLEAESIRDAILAVSGELDATMGGTLLGVKNHAYVYSTVTIEGVVYNTDRRSVYLPVVRSGLYDVFQAFDFADPSVSSGLRVPTTVAPQALFMMNDRLVLRCSEAMARRLLERPGLDDAGRIRHAYLAAYGRPPVEKEIARASESLRRFGSVLEAQGVAPRDRRVRAWQGLCQAIIAASEFIYLN
jgi:Protein of unknown function (DUF1553)/Protein of unknown function (DUF1549)/Planctomycete cytochrome C